MLNIAAIILASCAGGDLMPTKPGSFWKVMSGEKESTWKLSELPEHHGVPEVEVGRGGVNPQLHAEPPAGRERGAEVVGFNNLGDPTREEPFYFLFVRGHLHIFLIVPP